MVKNIFIKKFYYFFFVFTSLFSYYLFLIYYDSTTGIDWAKYSTFINHYVFGTPLQAKDGQSILYYYLIAKIISFNLDSFNELNKNILLNNGIQFGNFLLQLFGFFGIYKYYLSLKFSKKNIIYVLSIINFFPPLIYLRLSYKSEMFAFALLPWVLVLLNKLKEKKLQSYEKFLLIALSSVLLTIKPSITIMVSLFIFFLHYEDVYRNKNMIFIIGTVSLLLLFLNFQVVQTDFISHNTENTRWDNVAPASFFYTINIKSLILEPIFNIQSESLISILLLDTYSDYFTLFWKHKEPTNYLAFGQINYFKNFHINLYLRDYIAIFLSFFTYVLSIYYFFKTSNQLRIFFAAPFIGIFILIINSLGFPSNNFDPNSADTFKVHYFAFFLVLTFIQILLVNKKENFYYFLLIPIFIFIMGFPKTNTISASNDFLFKIQESNICFLLEITQKELQC